MPNYEYKCTVCETTEVRNVPMSERGDQQCVKCYHPLERVWNFDGRVWAPTAGGTR